MGEADFVILRRTPFPEKMPEINLPASKSIANRLLIMRAMSGSLVNIENLSTANDTQILAAALGSNTDMFVGDAGTALRFGLAWAAITPGKRKIYGTERLHERPIQALVEALKAMGAEIRYLEKPGFSPLEVVGRPLAGGEIQVDGSLSSQFVSALMLIAPYCQNPCLFRLAEGQVSKPYIALTAQLMSHAGAAVDWKENTISIGRQPYGHCTIAVEPDWSAAAFFYAFVALKPGSRIRLKGLKLESIQGDRVCAELFAHFGVQTTEQIDGILISHSGNTPSGLAHDFSDCPDLAQAAAVTAAGLQLNMTLTGLSTLRNKETDRIAAIQSELAKLGVRSEATHSTLMLFPSHLRTEPSLIETFDDHRMAMAFAALSAIIPELRIENPSVVAKSFPGFWQEFDALRGGF